MQFKHQDTRLLIALALVYAVASGGAWWLWGAASLPVAVGVALVLVLGLQLQLYRVAEQEEILRLNHTQALMWLHRALPLRAPLPPLTRWAASAEFAATLAEAVWDREPGVVVELGSGASSLVLGYALEEVGRGRVVSLDHDGAFAEETRRRVARHGLADRVEVLHAPLREQEVEGRRVRWYDLDGMDLPDRIDLLVIDGPPLETNPLARHPAGPLLFDRLGPDAVVILDDARRADEAEAVRRWAEAHGPFEVSMRPSPRGTAVLTRRVRTPEPVA